MNVNSDRTRDGGVLDLDQFLPYRLTVLAARVSKRVAAEYSVRFGISIPEWRVIAHLARCRKVSVREIHDCVNMDKSRVSRAAARLEMAKLIGKKPNPGDRRLVELSLTRKGWRLYEKIVPLALAIERELLEALEEDERRALSAAINKFHTLLDTGEFAPKRPIDDYAVAPPVDRDDR